MRRSFTVGAFVVGAILTATGLTKTCPANAAMDRDTSRATHASEGLSEEARTVRERAIQ